MFNNKKYKYRLEMMRIILNKIDKLLDELDFIDVYGDVVQNFEDEYRERHTKRLINMITNDLRR